MRAARALVVAQAGPTRERRAEPDRRALPQAGEHGERLEGGPGEPRGRARSPGPGRSRRRSRRARRRSAGRSRPSRCAGCRVVPRARGAGVDGLPLPGRVIVVVMRRPPGTSCSVMPGRPARRSPPTRCARRRPRALRRSRPARRRGRETWPRARRGGASPGRPCRRGRSSTAPRPGPGSMAGSQRDGDWISPARSAPSAAVRWMLS